MNAATDATIKLTLSQSVTKLSSAVITLTNANFGLKKQVSDLTAKKSLIESAPSQIASNISQSKSSAQLLCAKGL